MCLLFIHPPAHGSEVSPAARNTLDSARIPRASKLLICGLFLKGRVLAQDALEAVLNELALEIRYNLRSAEAEYRKGGEPWTAFDEQLGCSIDRETLIGSSRLASRR